MRWTYLGHAMWLAEVGPLRLLFDPLLTNAHHGDVFEVFPPRRIDAERLAADFIVVSHRHPDHFDVRSLARLARLDPDTVVLTSDELCADTARRVGFREVRVLGTFDRVTLSGAELLTTPSFGTELEWGVLVRDPAVCVWNQVDSVMRNVADVTGTLARAASALDAGGRLALDLALVRWQPLLEVQAALAERAGFPEASYGSVLEQVAALGARAVVPASAGSRHAAPYAYMNRLVYPVPEPRFLRDMALSAPETTCLPARMGARYEVTRDGTRDAGPGDLCEVDVGASDDRIFCPFEVPPLTDATPLRPDERAKLRAWVETELSPALGRAQRGFGTARTLRFVLEIVHSDEREPFSLEVGPESVRLTRGFDADYDALNSVAASLLLDVIEGRRHWGEPLLAGCLRSSLRAYEVDATRLTRLDIAPIFLYYALPYAESVRRATDWLISSDPQRP